MDPRVLPAVHHLMDGRTHRILRLGAAALSTILVLSACRSPEPSPRTSAPPAAARDAFAIWPEETPSEAASAVPRLQAGEDPWRTDPEETALAFAREVLGWPDPVVGTVQEQPGGLMSVEVLRGPDGPSVSVRLARLLEDRWWSVYNAWGTVEHDPSVAVRHGRLELRFDMEDAASAHVVVEYGDARYERDTDLGRVLIDLGHDPTEPGYFLVLLRDARGRVFDVASSPLPAGAFAAG